MTRNRETCTDSLLPTSSDHSGLGAVQSILRIARNEAGHPTSATVNREQVYVYLQIFIPFARQLMRLRRALA